jgi:transcription antitermination factor NusG
MRKSSNVHLVSLGQPLKSGCVEIRHVSPRSCQGSPWYVVWSEARAEKKVAERLVAKGFAVWLPTVTQKHRWSDRWKMVTKPLFPGYLFASTSDGYVPLLRTPGVLTLVKEGLRPATLTSDYIEGLQHLVENPELAVESMTREEFVPGDEVLVREGPLTGHRGQIVELRGARRLVIWIESVGRGILCTLGDAAVTLTNTA